MAYRLSGYVLMISEPLQEVATDICRIKKRTYICAYLYVIQGPRCCGYQKSSLLTPNAVRRPRRGILMLRDLDPGLVLLVSLPVGRLYLPPSAPTLLLARIPL